jgi:hypothetical protein
VRDSFIETLVGVYHPRITYPGRGRPERDGGRSRDRSAELTTAESEELRKARERLTASG